MRIMLFAVFALAACAQNLDAPVLQPASNSELVERIRADNTRLDRELAERGIVVAGIGETADLGAGLTVRPLEVIEDSRCAANVQCVWAGRLRLRANISGGETELTLGEPLETPHGTLLFAVAKPGAWADWPANEPRPAYRFGFRRG